MKDSLSVASERAAAILAEALREHEQKGHRGGARCSEERINAIAFLIHKLGLDNWEEMISIFSRTLAYRKRHDEAGFPGDSLE